MGTGYDCRAEAKETSKGLHSLTGSWLQIQARPASAKDTQRGTVKAYEGLRGSNCCGEGESCRSGTSAMQLLCCFDGISGGRAVFRWPESALLACSPPAHSACEHHTTHMIMLQVLLTHAVI